MYNRLLQRLGLCGCGCPDCIIKMFNNYLEETEKHFKEYNNEDWNKVYNDWCNYKENFIEKNKDLLFEFMLHFLNENGYLEHGSSVYASWVTDKGRKLIEDSKKIEEEE